MTQRSPGSGKPGQPARRGVRDRVPEEKEPAPDEPIEFLGISARYPALSMLHQVIVGFGVVIFLLGLAGVIYVVARVDELSSENIFVALTPVGALLGGVVVAAFGQLLKVLMDIEANTRRHQSGS
jgi:hypothetical protein